MKGEFENQQAIFRWNKNFKLVIALGAKNFRFTHQNR